MNEAACERLGYSREELLSMTVFEIDPDYPREGWTAVWNRLKAEGSMALETRHVAKDGNKIPVEVTANFLEFDGKEYIFGFVRDITERKRAEEALRESEERFRQLAENIHGVFWLIELGDSPIHKKPTKYLSPGFEEIWGRPRK
ncbi:MAG: PAS domain S-box protein, partial [Nitrospinota bacterium]|nr:PAS domain S-box protein [Nitrospinota bacterium]